MTGSLEQCSFCFSSRCPLDVYGLALHNGHMLGSIVIGTCDKKSHGSSRKREQVFNAHPSSRHASLVTVGCEARGNV
ncbi:MAG TPA: hypothetical protein VGL94_02330 [Ktedonobacteraceae bacterium]